MIILALSILILYLLYLLLCAWWRYQLQADALAFAHKRIARLTQDVERKQGIISRHVGNTDRVLNEMWRLEQRNAYLEEENAAHMRLRGLYLRAIAESKMEVVELVVDEVAP